MLPHVGLSSEADGCSGNGEGVQKKWQVDGEVVHTDSDAAPELEEPEKVIEGEVADAS